jgi:hypothetical protein
MDAAVMPGPVLQFFDTNGDPLAGGKLYAFAAGSSTPQNTYTDSALTVAFSHPIILNAAGEPSIDGTGASLPVYLLTTPAYKFVLKTSTDVIRWTADNIIAVAAAS